MTATAAATAGAAVAGSSTGVEVAGAGMVYRRGRSKVAALEGCDLAVPAGQRAAIIGPSGCGKSTLLRMLADIIAPSAGRVAVAGRSPQEARRARAFALVSQQTVMLPWRRLAANVGLALEVMRSPAAERRVAVAEVIELVGLTGFEANYPAELSGGMRQRAAIARALTLRPEVLLMDEPFGALDELTRERLNFELLRILGETRATLVLVTHSIPEAILLSDVVFVMSERPGRIVRRLDIELGPRTPQVRDDPRFRAYEHELRVALAA